MSNARRDAAHPPLDGILSVMYWHLTSLSAGKIHVISCQRKSASKGAMVGVNDVERVGLHMVAVPSDPKQYFCSHIWSASALLFRFSLFLPPAKSVAGVFGHEPISATTYEC